MLECEVERVLSAMMPVNALVMRVMLHTGLRVGDVLALRVPLRVQMWKTEKKTGKRRHIRLTQQLIDEMGRRTQDYLPPN